MYTSSLSPFEFRAGIPPVLQTKTPLVFCNSSQTETSGISLLDTITDTVTHLSSVSMDPMCPTSA